MWLSFELTAFKVQAVAGQQTSLVDILGSALHHLLITQTTRQQTEHKASICFDSPLVTHSQTACLSNYLRLILCAVNNHIRPSLVASTTIAELHVQIQTFEIRTRASKYQHTTITLHSYLNSRKSTKVKTNLACQASIQTMFPRGRSKESKDRNRKVTPPGPVYMSNDQFGTFALDPNTTALILELYAASIHQALPRNRETSEPQKFQPAF